MSTPVTLSGVAVTSGQPRSCSMRESSPYLPELKFADFRVAVPEGELEGAVIRRRGFYDGNQPEGSPLYWYTELTADGLLWMVDTDEEIADWLPAFQKAQSLDAHRVLINGLGLGCVVKAMITLPSVEHIDVVDRDERVIAMVAPSYPDPRIQIHLADAFDMQWPIGTRWDIAWHDVWRSRARDHRPTPEMTWLHRSYGNRVRWQGSWGRA